MITPTREDHGKALSCRATNELVRNGVRETAMKLNVFCKYAKLNNFFFTKILFMGLIKI